MQFKQICYMACVKKKVLTLSLLVKRYKIRDLNFKTGFPVRQEGIYLFSNVQNF